MSCALTTGRALSVCRDNVGGIKAIYVGDGDSISSMTASAGAISAITLAAGKFFFKYDLPKGLSQVTETTTGSRANGTRFTTTEVSVVLHKQDTATRNELKLLAGSRFYCIVQTQNNDFWFIGKENLCEISTKTAVTGTAMGDMNGYNLTISAEEPEEAYSISSGVVAGLLD